MLKLGIHVDSGQMYRVYRYQAAVANSSLYFFSFLSLQNSFGDKLLMSTESPYYFDHLLQVSNKSL